MNEIIDILRRNPLLSNLEHSTLEALLPELERIELNQGQLLFKKGDTGDSYYIVESGAMKITTNDLTLNRLTAGQGFGEMSLLSDQPRSATAVADPEATLIRLSRAGFLQLTELQPDLVDQFYALMQSLMRHSLLATALRRICGEFEDAVLYDIEDEFVWEVYAPGEVILQQGAPGDDALVIVSGRVRATFNHNETERVLGEVGSGSIVGEMSLLSKTTRSATVTAIRQTRVARMNHTVFEKIMRTQPEFALRLMEMMVERQQHNFDQDYIEKPTTLNITVAPTQDGIDITEFAHTLAKHLERHGTTLIIDRKRFDDLYGLKGALDHTHPTSVIIQLWLDELERSYDYVLYITDDSWSPWTSWAVRTADRVLLVGEAQLNPQPNPLERTIVEEITRQRHELVILHPPSTEQPANTAEWLKLRNVYRHHHIRKGDGAHFARLARLLTGNGIGLVLSGGGARGYIHLGVIKSLMEAQVPIDVIGATSMGAVVGGGLQAFMKYEALQERAAKLGSRKALLDFTFPLSALMRSKKVSDAMKTLYGDFRIEDGWISFFCISTNLSKASMKVHQSGPMGEAVRASMSIPGVFSPVVRDDDLLVDGGVMNNYPVDVMRQFLEGGQIIGSLVSGKESKSRPYKIEDYINGWQTFLMSILPGVKGRRVPSILKIILSATSVNSNQLITDFQRRTDFLLQTDGYPYGMLDFDKHIELVQKGYDAHTQAIQTWAQEHAYLIEQPPLWPPVQ